MKIFFLDTNVFLQCRDLIELPWNEISDGQDILLLISRPVQEEIDSLKHSGNSRRSKRARKTNSLFREIISSNDAKKVIRESDPHVELTFSLCALSSRAICDILDLTRTDDRIINEALSFLKDNPDSNVSLLTHDTNPMLTAKRGGLDYTVVPDDWLLPPELDERDKKVEELGRKVKELEKTYPAIKAVFKDENTIPVTSLTLNITFYDDLSEQKIMELVAEAQKRNPLITDFEKVPKHYPPFIIGSHYKPPTEKEIKEYREEQYPKWLEDVKNFFEGLPRKLELPNRHTYLFFYLTNSGNVPADNVIVEFDAHGGLLLDPPPSNDDKDKIFEIQFPSPPTPPRGKWINPIDILSGMRSIASPFQERDLTHLFPHKPAPKDRNAFYWKNGRPSSYRSSWVFECVEFRHKVDEEIFKIGLFVNRKNPSKGAIKAQVTAKNQPEPIILTLPIEVAYTKGDINSKANDILEKFLSKLKFTIRH